MQMTVLIIQALLGLVVYDLILRVGKFKMVHGLVGHWKVGRRAATGEASARIAHAVNLACVWYPKRVLCLQRSSVTTCLMRYHGIAAQMVLGAQKTPFKAHAWVEVNGHVANEQSDVQARYQVWERC